jgi:hypothetical protein
MHVTATHETSDAQLGVNAAIALQCAIGLQEFKNDYEGNHEMTSNRKRKRTEDVQVIPESDSD